MDIPAMEAPAGADSLTESNVQQHGSKGRAASPEPAAQAAGAEGSPKKSRSPHKFVPEGEKMTARFGALLKRISSKRDVSPATSRGAGIAVPRAKKAKAEGFPSTSSDGLHEVDAKVGCSAPCCVCGKWYDSMPPGAGGFCWVHKRVVDIMRKRWAPPQKHGKKTTTCNSRIERREACRFQNIS